MREALGLSGPKTARARWIGLRHDTFSDGSRRVVGVCHAHHTARGCPGHTLALRRRTDATACCSVCDVAVTTMQDAVERAQAAGVDAKIGSSMLGGDGQVTGWWCVVCSGRARGDK